MSFLNDAIMNEEEEEVVDPIAEWRQACINAFMNDDTEFKRLWNAPPSNTKAHDRIETLQEVHSEFRRAVWKGFEPNEFAANWMVVFQSMSFQKGVDWFVLWLWWIGGNFTDELTPVEMDEPLHDVTRYISRHVLTRAQHPERLFNDPLLWNDVNPIEATTWAIRWQNHPLYLKCRASSLYAPLSHPDANVLYGILQRKGVEMYVKVFLQQEYETMQVEKTRQALAAPQYPPGIPYKDWNRMGPLQRKHVQSSIVPVADVRQMILSYLPGGPSSFVHATPYALVPMEE
jgi:hypothetical protein